MAEDFKQHNFFGRSSVARKVCTYHLAAVIQGGTHP
jgi:hypothetical protein